jgi:mono/diheme cytochrome c family protein
MTRFICAVSGPALLLGASQIFAADAQSNAVATAQGAFTRAQAQRGRDHYATHCAACHADNLAGIGPALPLVGGTFQSKWASQTMFEFYERVRTTMPQNAPGSLGDAVYADIVAFILRANNFPTGANELTRNSAALKAMPMTGGQP